MVTLPRIENLVMYVNDVESRDVKPGDVVKVKGVIYDAVGYYLFCDFDVERCKFISQTPGRWEKIENDPEVFTFEMKVLECPPEGYTGPCVDAYISDTPMSTILEINGDYYYVSNGICAYSCSTPTTPIWDKYISTDKSEYVIGENVKTTIIVYNYGKTGDYSPLVSVYDSLGNVLYQEKIATKTILGGDYAIWTWYYTPQKAGGHTICIDSEPCVDFNVLEKWYDAHVAISAADVYRLYKGNTVVVQGYVTNITSESKSGTLKVTIDGTELYSEAISLNAGASKSFSFNWTITQEPGDYNLCAEVI